MLHFMQQSESYVKKMLQLLKYGNVSGVLVEKMKQKLCQQNTMPRILRQVVVSEIKRYYPPQVNDVWLRFLSNGAGRGDHVNVCKHN